MRSLSHEIALDLPYDQAVETVIRTLGDEGFGVLTRIDMHDAFRDKLGVDFRRYSILGACNPPLAHKAVSGHPEVGLMLPCNVTVEEHGEGSLVRIIDAEAMMAAGGMDEVPVLREVGSDAAARLERVAGVLRSATGEA